MTLANSPSEMTANLQALSDRERKTLRLLLQGHDAKSIARSLGISVHAVNERLRTSRRKLGVSSSREAARLLARSEQPTRDSDVDKQIGVAWGAEDVNKDVRRNGRKGLKHPVVLAIGGTLIMSLIIATAMLSWIASGNTEPGPLPNWSAATAALERASKPTNTVRVDGNRLLWNGEEASEAQIRQFLGITEQMNPRPMLILSYSAQTPVKRLQRVRVLIEEVIQCKPDKCLEVTP